MTLSGFDWRLATGVGLALAAAPYALAALYLGVLAALARPSRSRGAAGDARTRFDVLVPAHDEESGIAATLESLRAVAYPPERFRVLVVADNCRDRTAECAREAGALVLVRNDETRRGKGHALAHGFARSLRDAVADAVVVVDADTLVSANLLHALDQAIARGETAMQVHYAVRDADRSWRTRLLALGLVLFHGVRSLARERLGVSCGLRGNGMCFRSEVLRRVPYRAFSIVEDVEYGLQLGLAGVRVAYVPDAEVRGEMPAVGAAARSQRERWEGGRSAVRRTFAGPLLRAGLSRRDVMLFDLAADLLVPPLSRLVAITTLGCALSLGATVVRLPSAPALAIWSVAMLALAAYVARGCALTADAARTARDLAWAPLYMLWKTTIASRRVARNAGEWVRTSRAADT